LDFCRLFLRHIEFGPSDVTGCDDTAHSAKRPAIVNRLGTVVDLISNGGTSVSFEEEVIFPAPHAQENLAQ
jgi:hypothetical protein